MDNIVLIGYFVSLSILFIFGLHGFVLLYYHRKYKDVNFNPTKESGDTPLVTIQLPLYNELYVIERLIDKVCEIEYPKDKLEIQVLDDSTDETVDVVAKAVEAKFNEGFFLLRFDDDICFCVRCISVRDSEMSSFFIGNDSGLGHIASAVSVPSLTLFGIGEPQRYHPWGAQATWLQGDNNNINSITVNAVVQAVKTGLSGRKYQ